MNHILRYLYLLAAVAVLAAGTAALLARCAGRKTLNLGGHSLPLRWGGASHGETFTRSMALRAALWAGAYLAALYAVTALFCAVARGSMSLQGLADAFRKSDAAHYRNLAKLGYHDCIEDGQHLFLVFFPLYPWTVRAMHVLFGNYDLCAHLVSGLSFIAGCVMFARLMTEDLGWAAARTGLGLLMAWPFSFFFAGAFTESLFFFLSVTTFYLIRRRRWLWAGLIGALAALTRMQGILLACAGLAQYWVDERPLEKLHRRQWQGLRADLVRKLLPLGLMGLGVAVYLWLNWDVEGEPFRFAFYQRDHWFQYPVPLTRCLAIIWDQLAIHGGDAFAYTTLVPELAVFALAAAGFLYAAGALPIPWTVYLLGCLVLNYSLSWPLSCGRYMACAFPMFAALARFCRRRPALGQAATGVFSLLQGAYLYAFLTGTTIY